MTEEETPEDTTPAAAGVGGGFLQVPGGLLPGTSDCRR